MESSQVAALITSLTNLHQTQRQALFQLCQDQVQQIKGLLNTMAEDQQVLQALEQQDGIPAPRHPHQDETKGQPGSLIGAVRALRGGVGLA